MAATKTTTLLDLAQNFDKYMFGYGIKPIAKGFTVPDNTVWKDRLFWEILDVRHDGKYPCVSDTIVLFDQNTKVVIQHIDN